VSDDGTQKLLRMSGIRKSFSGVEVLHGVQFDLDAGEVHVLAGENGAGKSTLVKILAGVYGDYSGRIELAGKRVRFKSVQEAASRGISVIHQELSLVGPMTIAENIFLGREPMAGLWPDEKVMRQEADKLLREFGLEIDVRRKVEDYPLSIQQMIEICKALAFRSRIIVMDEPTSALTEPEVEKLFVMIGTLKSKGCGIIYISHRMEEIYRIADRITVLRDGKYIGTEEASTLERDRLIQWMVGRELKEQFPRHFRQTDTLRLEVDNFTVPDPRPGRASLVDDVSFCVDAGEILGIAGLSGSGSSELLSGIFGAYGGAVKGEIKIDGEHFVPGSPAEAIRRGIALLTNDRKESGLAMDMDIVENVTLPSLEKFAPNVWLHPAYEMEMVSNVADWLKLRAASLRQPVGTLSGGNQQKVVMAKWIATEPRVMLLDEPTRGVDVGAKHQIYEMMNDWTGEEIAIVLITSEMPELLAMSDRIMVMHRGRVTGIFTRHEATGEKILKAAMGHTNGDD
jgi:ribose transport system ATP-binding protein